MECNTTSATTTKFVASTAITTANPVMNMVVVVLKVVEKKVENEENVIVRGVSSLYKFFREGRIDFLETGRG